MKKLFLLSVAATLISSLSFATIRRVGFFGPPVSGVDYGSLQLAHDAASTGDTIMMMPGSSVTGTISKGVIIIGPGYLLDPNNGSLPGNAGLQANTNSTSANAGTVFFAAGSSNSQVLGCTLLGMTFSGSGLSNILIKRCHFPTQGNIGGSLISFQASASNITFQQCIIVANISGQGSSGALTNLSFLNCSIEWNILFPNNPIASGLVSNCIFPIASFAPAFGSGAWQIQNCISQAGIFTGTNIVYNNNIGTGTQFPAGNGNQQNKPWNTIFNLTGSYDGKYTLKAGSPAIGAGINGAAATDAGIFGGATPYRLSGIPSVPTIYQLTSPQGTIPAGNTVQINLSTRSNN